MLHNVARSCQRQSQNAPKRSQVSTQRCSVNHRHRSRAGPSSPIRHFSLAHTQLVSGCGYLAHTYINPSTPHASKSKTRPRLRLAFSLSASQSERLTAQSPRAEPLTAQRASRSPVRPQDRWSQSPTQRAKKRARAAPAPPSAPRARRGTARERSRSPLQAQNHI